MSHPGDSAAGGPSVCLSMIVRDEAHVVREALDSMAPFIQYWVIVDTGSIDGTPSLIRTHMDQLGIPGELHERPWRDFAHNRTEALELSRGHGDYAWVMDADDVLVGTPDLPSLTLDSYLVPYGTDFRYWRKQLFRDGLRWRYEGVVHEYPMCADVCTEARLEGDFYVESRRLGSRSRDPHKYERDRDLLLAVVERDPDDARSTFYLAQSCFDAGDLEAAHHWYRRRSEMPGWDEETFYALLRRAECLAALGAPWPEVQDAYLVAWEHRPTRAEPLHEIAHHHRVAGNHAIGHLFASRAASIPFPHQDNLFVRADVYAWRAHDELAVCAANTGRHAEAFALCRGLLAGDALPEVERERVAANRDHSVPALLEESASYPSDIVDLLTAASESATAEAEVTLTITSCMRPELFERSVNSFLRCCTDLDRIGRWICIDNGSSPADVARIRQRYPFFEVVELAQREGGHATALNRLRDMVTGPYWLHVEDDWQFFAPEAYVSRAIEILDDDETIQQVTFNVNYGETLEARGVVGGEVRRTTATGRRYRVHEYLPPGGAAWAQLIDRLPPGARTAAYWPHYTLRPSLMRTATMRSLGSFDDDAGFFERVFADRYAAAGYRTAFLDEIVCLHIGRRTDQAKGEGAPSAYDLVGDGRHPGHVGSLEVRLINLDRRPDRLAEFTAGLADTAGRDLVRRCRRSAAVDGRTLHMTDELAHLFRNNDFGYRRGMVGCALSHIGIWRDAASGSSPYLVFEDDARVDEGFMDGLREVLRALDEEHGWDLALLGYLVWDDAPVDPPAPPGAAPIRAMRWDRYLGGNFAYLLSPDGARRLLDIVDRDGVQQGIDWFVMGHGHELRCLEALPQLARASLAIPGSDTDSDIQHDMAPVAPPPVPLLTTLAPSAVLGELQLDLPNGWMPRAASVLATADGYRVVVPTDVGDERRTVVAHLDDALDVLTVTVADDHEPADEDRVQVPGGELRIVQSSHGAEGGSQFVLVDDGRRAAASPSFRIVAGTGEQRCSGLAEREGELVVSFALDGRLGLAVVETAEILALLHPDGTLTSSTSSEVP